MNDHSWPILLYNRSPLKQAKFEQLADFLGHHDHLRCLDLGSDNGVISYLLRSRGGHWKSADLDETTVRSIRALVHSDVYRIDGRRLPFHEDEFDRVVIVDLLEHIETDSEFISELFRVLRPGGELIINVPHVKHTLLRKIRLAIGQNDEKHGHVRPGYTIEDLQRLLAGQFILLRYHTYSKFFSECVDTLIQLGSGWLAEKNDQSRKGVVVTGSDLHRHAKVLKIYSLFFPFVWLFAKLDCLLFWCAGYMLVAKARSTKRAA